MDVLMILNIKYAELCKKLGDVEVNLIKLNESKSELLQQIESLNSVAPLLKPPAPPVDASNEKKD